MLAGAVSVVIPLRFLHILTRMAGAALFAGAATTAAAGLLVPAGLQRVAGERTDLDRAMPAYQFQEHHRTHVNAAPEDVYRAVRAVTADEILLFRTLTWIRSPRLRQPDGGTILQPPAEPVPLLDVALRTTFRQLSEVRGRELVVGTRIARGVNAPMNFLIEPAADGTSELSTETRVFAETPGATR